MIITSYTYVFKGEYREKTFKIKADWIQEKCETIYTGFYEYTNNRDFSTEQTMSIERLTMEEKSLMIWLVDKGVDFKVNVWKEEDIVEGKEVDFDFHF
jgi:DNA replication initiation complex subunit (GINS family)